MYIKGMKLNDDIIKNRSALQVCFVWPTCALMLLLAAMMLSSIDGCIIFFLMILLLNACVVLYSDWKVSRKMKSKEEFYKVQKYSAAFFIIEFVLAVIEIFYGLSESFGILFFGCVMVLLSVGGVFHSAVLKVDYD